MDIKEYLRAGIPLFKDFPDVHLEELARKGEELSFEPGEAVIEFGEKPRFLGILLEGEAEQSVTDNRGEKYVLGIIKAGDFFGEVSLMTGEKTIADVVGVTRCRAFLIPYDLFATKVITHPPAVNFLSRRIAHTLKNLAADQQYREHAGNAPGAFVDPYGFRLKTGAPMKLLMLSSGAGWLEYEFFDTREASGGGEGFIEGIGSTGTRHFFEGPGGHRSREEEILGYKEALEKVVEQLSVSGLIQSPGEIAALGHRVVHGGDLFSGSVLINREVTARLERLSPLASLHNPVNLEVIREAGDLFPGANHVAVFDTAFHHTMPAYAYLYGLPYEFYEKYRLRRYGFHGLSHLYGALKGSEYLRKPFNAQEIITCHLGRGTSLCAIDHARSVDTSMGFTPAEGVLMETRSGNLDPDSLLYLMEQEDLSPGEARELINRKSGLLGLTGVSGHLGDLEKMAVESGHNRAILGIKTYAYQIKKSIGAYMAAMGGLDLLVFTGKIGVSSPLVRSLACQGLDCMGIELDRHLNARTTSVEAVTEISSPRSTVRVLVVKNEEKLMMAREVLKVLEQAHVTRILKSQEPPAVPLEISAHHIHLTREHVEALFGKGYQLKVKAELSQPGQFACEETVTLEGPRGQITRVRVLGPERPETQIEIARTEQFKLGIQPPVRESGDIEGSPGVRVTGPAGTVDLDKGVICAMRHIHMTPADAITLGLKDKDLVRVRIGGDRELIFGDVLIRVKESYRLAMHLDTDEANAGDIKNGMTGVIDSIQSRGGY